VSDLQFSADQVAASGNVLLVTDPTTIRGANAIEVYSTRSLYPEALSRKFGAIAANAVIISLSPRKKSGDR
jgi:hypothetical protein